MIVVNASLGAGVEMSSEYVEDQKKEIKRNGKGQCVRMKMKISVGYKGILGSLGFFRNVQVQLQLPMGVIADKSTFKFESMTFGGRENTPQVVQLYLYPSN